MYTIDDVSKLLQVGQLGLQRLDLVQFAGPLRLFQAASEHDPGLLLHLLGPVNTQEQQQNRNRIVSSRKGRGGGGSFPSPVRDPRAGCHAVAARPTPPLAPTAGRGRAIAAEARSKGGTRRGRGGRARKGGETGGAGVSFIIIIFNMSTRTGAVQPHPRKNASI